MFSLPRAQVLSMLERTVLDANENPVVEYNDDDIDHPTLHFSLPQSQVIEKAEITPIAAGEHPNPIEYADVVTSTTHKTLRGPRGGIILTNNEEIAKKIDRTIFPGIQGGPLMHIIAAKAVAFKEALAPEYKEYQKQVVKNAKAMSEELISGGLRIVSGGTDNHLMLVDLRPKKVTGKLAEEILEKAGITCNKNAIPNDPEKPFVTSGVRLGTPAITARGMKENEARIIAKMIIKVLENANDENKINEVKSEILELTKKFPLYKGK